MLNPPDNPSRWQMPRLSITHFLAAALLFSLILSGYLLLRLNEHAQVALQTPTISPANSSVLVQPAQVTSQTPSFAGSTPLTSSDIDRLVTQMQAVQSRLQGMATQLDQKSQSAGFVAFATATPIPIAGEDLPALWAEIEQLSQVMQPLMVQIETATATRSSRSASEMAALRTQVNTIHQRLAYLLARVEAAQARANAGSGTNTTQQSAPVGSPAQLTGSDLAMFEQLYKNMTELQHLLHQMQSQSSNP